MMIKKTISFKAALFCIQIHLLLAPISSEARLFDDLEDLEGRSVIYAGDFENVRCPYGGKYDCDKFPRNLLKAKGKSDLCINTTSINGCSLSCKGLIATDRFGKTEVFLFESSLGSDLKKHGFEAYKCPSMY